MFRVTQHIDRKKRNLLALPVKKVREAFLAHGVREMLAASHMANDSSERS